MENTILEKEIYIIYSRSVGGTGTKSDPYRATNGEFDKFVPLFGDNCKLRFGPGTYTTAGFKVPKNFILIGAGKDLTTLKLIDNAKNNYPHVRMITDNGWSILFVIKDLTLDGNWNGQATASTNGNFKVEPLVVKTVRGKASNIRVINFGANGANYPNLGLEAFPLALATFSNGEPFSYDLRYEDLKNKEPQTYLEIEECEVLGGVCLNGGYSTAISIITNQGMNAGDRQPIGLRTTRSATIRNNYVNVPGNIAFGAADAEMVWFEGNIAQDCKCAFNFDTNVINRLTIVGNQCLNCNQGMNITPSGAGQKITIERNMFTMAKQWFNSIMNMLEPYYAINCQYIIESQINSNILIHPEDQSLIFISHPLNDVTSTNNNWIKQSGSSNSGETESLKISIASLNNIIAAQNFQIQESENKITEMGKTISAVSSQLSLSNQKILTLETAIRNHKTIITNIHANEDLWRNV